MRGLPRITCISRCGEPLLATIASFVTLVCGALFLFISWHALAVKMSILHRPSLATIFLLEGLSIASAVAAYVLLIQLAWEGPRRGLLVVMCCKYFRSFPHRNKAYDVLIHDREEMDTDRLHKDVYVQHREHDAISLSLNHRNVVHATSSPSSPHLAGHAGRSDQGDGKPVRAVTYQVLMRAALVSAVPLICIHFLIHFIIPSNHRQSQELVIAMLRCISDVSAVLIFVAAVVVKVVVLNWPPSWSCRHHYLCLQCYRHKERVWLAVMLFIMLIGYHLIDSHGRSVPTIPHLQRTISDGLFDACSVVDLQMNPALGRSWVWPAIVPRRLFNFYAGSERCSPYQSVSMGYIDDEEEVLIIPAQCPTGEKPIVFLETPSESEMNGSPNVCSSVRNGSEVYHRNLEARYGSSELAEAAGVIVHRDPSTGRIAMVQIDPSTLLEKLRTPRNDAERAARGKWRVSNVLVVPLGRSAAYTVRCPLSKHEEYFVFPVPSDSPVPSKDGETACHATFDGNAPNDSEVLGTEAAKGPHANILLIVFDAVSRQEVTRSLPRFTQWVRDFHKRRSKAGGHMVVESLGHTTLGGSTARNLVPMLAGRSFFSESRRGTEKRTGSYLNHTIFSNAKRKYGDQINTATTCGFCHDFYDVMLGHTNTSDGAGGPMGSIDHYLYQPMCHIKYSAWEGNFQGPYSVLRRCIGQRYVHEHLLNYTTYLLRRQLRNRAKALQSELSPSHGTACDRQMASFGKHFLHFAYFIEGHEGSHAVLPLVDEALTEFMQELEDTLHFFEDPQNTLIFAADHGNHMGHYASFTRSGKFETVTPAMLYFIHPDVMRRIDVAKGRQVGESKNNFLQRTTRISSPLDTYMTINDLLGVYVPPADAYADLKVAPRSLFDSRTLNESITCSDIAGFIGDSECLLSFCTPKAKA